MKKYRHLFFDLDGTLWDFVSNAEETQSEMFDIFGLGEYCISFEAFFKTFQIHNDVLWSNYQRGRIKKEKLKWWRFYLTLKDFGLDDKQLAMNLDNFYLSEAPNKTKLIEGALEILNYLKINYQLHIITNGFNEVQYLKLKNSQLFNFFQEIITSEDAGALKPDPIIFGYALEKSGAKSGECLMIGDILDVDILGARNAGIDQVFLNQNGLKGDFKPTFEIFKLEELKKFL